MADPRGWGGFAGWPPPGTGAPAAPSRLEAFRGFARSGYEDADGSFEIFTVKPGPVAGPGPPGASPQAPHIDVSVSARGRRRPGVTRICYSNDPQANAADPVLASVPADRRQTLLAERVADGYRFDIHLQGPRETVFFAI